MTMESRYRRYYQKWHTDDANHRLAMRRAYKALYGPLLEEVPRGPVLDMGCGMGFMLEFLQEEGFGETYGYDSDEEQVNTCRSHHLNVIRSGRAAEAIEKFPGPYSLITAFDFLEHLPPEVALETLRSAYAALREGGTFICTVPNANSALASRWRYNDYTHCTSFTEHSLDYLLFGAGFADITVLPAEIPRRFSIKNPRSIWDWCSHKVIRTFRRWEMVTELGAEGKVVPLSLNIVGIARK